MAARGLTQLGPLFVESDNLLRKFWGQLGIHAHRKPTLDDWGLTALSAQHRADLPIETMKALGEPTLADAILDRIVHHSHRIELKIPGESMRKPPKPVDA